MHVYVLYIYIYHAYVHIYIYVCVFIMHINDDDEEEGNKKGEIRKGSLPCGVTLGSALSKNRYKKNQWSPSWWFAKPQECHIFIYISVYICWCFKINVL